MFNARDQTARGPILSVAHEQGAVYHNAWIDRPLKPEIVESKAMHSLPLDPQASSAPFKCCRRVREICRVTL